MTVSDPEHNHPDSYLQWQDWNEFNVRAFYKRLDELIKTRRSGFKQKQLCDALNIKEVKFSSLKNENQPWDKIGDIIFRSALAWLNKRNLLFDKIITIDKIETSDDIYRGLSKLLNMRVTDFAMADAYLVGTYVAFRRSNYLGGDFILRGYIKIHTEDDGAIKTTEEFRIQKELAEQEKHYRREGFLLYRDGTPIIISRKLESNDLQFIIIQTVIPVPSGIHQEAVLSMDGVIFHLQDNEIYATRIALFRTDPKEFNFSTIEAFDLKTDCHNNIKVDVLNILSKGIRDIQDGLLVRFT